MINYAVLYGKTAFTLAKDINVTSDKAQEFIDAYFAGFPRVRTFIDSTLETARTRGYVETLFGRRRMAPDLNNRNFQNRHEAERKAVNFPIQGTAADILKRAMLGVHEALLHERAQRHRAESTDDPDGARRAGRRESRGSDDAGD